MSREKTHITIQDIEFNKEGVKTFKKADFIKTWKDKKIKRDGEGKEIGKVKGKIGRFDPEKAWAEIEKLK